MRRYGSVRRKQNSTVIEKMAHYRLGLLFVACKPFQQASAPNINTNQKYPPINYGLLSKDEANQWIVAEKDGIKKPEGTYAFICTQRGFVRITPAPKGKTNHLGLADYAYRVRYAGIIHFELTPCGESVLKFWNNESGGYKPSSKLASLAGLPINLFKPYEPNQSVSEIKDEVPKLNSIAPASFSLFRPAMNLLPCITEDKKCCEQDSGKKSAIIRSASDPWGNKLSMLQLNLTRLEPRRSHSSPVKHSRSSIILCN